MFFKNCSNLKEAIQFCGNTLINYGSQYETATWQAVKTNLETHALHHISFSAPIPLYIPELIQQTSPNLPWAEDHFKERISGIPLNPGNEYLNWPYYPKQDNHIRNEGGWGDKLFTHTYMERFWPKYAGMFSPIPSPTIESEWEELKINGIINKGIRYNYGDLNSIVDLLKKDPNTRQAFLPIWFPEDTGAVHGGRVPCTLGYLFNLVDNKLDITYYIRSCDFIRHFKDDIYLACRLVQWLLNKLGSNAVIPKSETYKNIPPTYPFWDTIIPGNIIMHISNLHIFTREKSLVAKFYGK